MSIRVQTLRNMAGKGRSVYRVRRRGWDEPRKFDEDGDEYSPDTWARWEEEYYSTWAYARQATEEESDGWRRRGYMDQVKAARVLARLEAGGVELSTWEDGKHRLVFSLMVENSRYVG